MIFTFPAIVSTNVDQRLLPGITKSLEQYFLMHMAAAISSYAIRFVIDLNANSTVRGITVESNQYDLNQTLVSEAGGILRKPKEIGSQSPVPSEPPEEQPPDDTVKVTYKKNGKGSNKPRNPKDDPRYKIVGKGTNAGKLEIAPGLGFTPTMMTLDIDIWTRGGGKGTTNDSKPIQRPIIIGVKVIPTIAKNFPNMYQAIRDDYFASQFRYMYKAATRAILRTLWTQPVTQTLKKWYELAMGTTTPDQLGSSKLDWYLSVLLSKKGLLDAGGFSPETHGLAYRQYTSAIAIMNKDEKEDMFSDPGRLQRLFLMGWNSFVICNQQEKSATFCSNLDKGRCVNLPYSHIFKSMNAENIYKNYEELERSSGGFLRKIQSSPLNINRLSKESYINSKYKGFMIND